MSVVRLESGTQWVIIGDIPRLIADALCPSVPDSEQRRVVRLMKQALDSTLAARWCGEGNNFPVSMTDADLQWLNDGPWASLPALQFGPEDEAGLRTLTAPVLESEWDRYATALDMLQPQGWRVIADWRNPQLEQLIQSHNARKEHLKAVQEATAKGQLTPRDPVARTPKPEAVGNYLLRCCIPVAEFAAYAAQYGAFVPAVPLERTEGKEALAQDAQAQEPKQWWEARYNIPELIATKAEGLYATTGKASAFAVANAVAAAINAEEGRKARLAGRSHQDTITYSPIKKKYLIGWSYKPNEARP